MKIVHVATNRNKRIRAIPVTGNYLTRGDNGEFIWAEPNDRWRMFSQTGGQKCLITHIRRDNTEHSDDLWLYSNLTANEIAEIASTPDLRNEMMDRNRLCLDRTRKWYIRQFVENPERVGIKRFTGLPLGAFWDLWRQEVNAAEFLIYGLSNGQMKVVYGDFNFNVFMKWPELQRDMRDSNSFMTKGNVRWTNSNTVVPWIHKNCLHGFIPFSDYDVMFPDVEEEFAYTADVA